MQQNRKENRGMSKARIIVVDDDSTMRNLLVDVLTGEGYETASVMSGEDGIHELEAKQYDLAIVDLNLPGWISGLDLLQEIRVLRPKMKVMVCSAQKDSGTMEAASRLGSEGFIEKPIEDLAIFLSRVKTILGREANPDLKEGFIENK